MKIKFEWEEIDNNNEQKEQNWWEATYRAKVIGGWLVRHECAHEYIFYSSEDENHDVGEEWAKRFYTMIFIPDIDHKWEISES